MKKLEQVGFCDLASISAQRDTCLVLPTLSHAFWLWLYYREFCCEYHNPFYKTKTGVAFQDTRTQLRLWVPYEREPTMVMDFVDLRRDYYLVSPYSSEGVPT